MINDQDLLRLEDEYWQILTKLNLIQYINPININDEKNIFFKYLDLQKKYNPMFKYMSISFNYKTVEKNLLTLQKNFKKLKHPLSISYIQRINFDLSIIHFLKARSNNIQNYNFLLTSLYGIPSDEFYKKVKDITKTINVYSLQKKENNFLDSKQVKEIFFKRLQERNIINWKILLDEIPSKISVNTLNKTIKINKYQTFSSLKVKSLIEHEIGTHILRYENGLKQKYKIFRYGFPNYLQTEEGLAILSEHKNNLLSNDDMLVYCCRVIGSYFSNQKNFYELFNIINSYTDDLDLSFTITTRIKRGLIDTSLYGGYTKDQVYLAGFFQLKNFDNETLKKLYCGKIGFKDIKVTNSLDDIYQDYILPKWLE